MQNQTLKIEIPNGFEIDFDKSSGEIKFKAKPKNVMERIMTISASFVGSRLCFKSSELAEHAGKNFTSVYKQFMVIE